jgi:hypothetical protein
LVGLQLFLNRRMRRLLNPGLLAASAIAILFMGYTLSLLNAASGHLKVATQDAFDSLIVLRKARALAYSANGDESRYLLDPQRASQYEQAFFQKIDQVGKTSAGATFETIAKTALAPSRPGELEPVVFAGFQGFLADQLKNITFGDLEKIATANTILTFGEYLKIDKKIRDLQATGQRQAAIALCVGNNPGESNWAFDQYKDAHQQVLNVNMAEFQKNIQRSFQAVGVDARFKIQVNPKPATDQAKAANEDINILATENRVEATALTRYEAIAVAAIVAIVLLTLMGLMPRFKEYSR